MTPVTIFIPSHLSVACNSYFLPMPLNTDNLDLLIACSECDLLLEKVPLQPGYKAHCPRCGHLLYHPVPYSVDKILALSWTGLFLSIPAYFLPILQLTVFEDEQSISMFSGVVNLFKTGYWLVAMAVLLTSIVLPVLKKLLLLYIAWNLKLHRKSRKFSVVAGLAWAFRGYRALAEWSMLEVFILGIMVAAIKLRDLGELHAATGLYCFIAVLLVSILQTLNLDTALFWRLIAKVRDDRDN